MKQASTKFVAVFYSVFFLACLAVVDVVHHFFW